MIRRTKWKWLQAMAAAVFTAACDDPIALDDHLDEPIVGVEITDLGGGPIASYVPSAWSFASGDALHLHVGEALEVRILFVTADGERLSLPSSGAEHTLRVEIANPAIAGYHAEDDHGHFDGIAEGETTAVIELMHGTHADFGTTPLPIEVVDHDH